MTHTCKKIKNVRKEFTSISPSDVIPTDCGEDLAFLAECYCDGGLADAP